MEERERHAENGNAKQSNYFLASDLQLLTVWPQCSDGSCWCGHMQWAASVGEFGLPARKVEDTLTVRPLLRSQLAQVTGGIDIFFKHI